MPANTVVSAALPLLSFRPSPFVISTIPVCHLDHPLVISTIPVCHLDREGEISCSNHPPQGTTTVTTTGDFSLTLEMTRGGL
ncbi:MAG: hypothetical protein WBN83_13395, partial [Desulfoprunum sp.]|uniref:hypothetical protein n=1 Tax=Desulfoprunum sp. TaxID=2020866 RepID=UPI003C70AC1C